MAEAYNTTISVKEYKNKTNHASLFVTEQQEKIKTAECQLMVTYRAIESEFKSFKANKDPKIQTAQIKLKEKIDAMSQIEKLSLLGSEKCKSISLNLEDRQSSDTSNVSDDFDVENHKNKEGVHLLITGLSGTGVTSTTQSIISLPSENLGLNVTECPGYRLEKNFFEKINCSISSLKKRLELCEYTFKGLIIVFKYGERVSRDFIIYIKLIKGILGEDVIKDHGVFVFTYGDKASSGRKKKFQKWCKKQKVVKENFSECGCRCVLFDNITTNLERKEEQVRELLSQVNQLKTYSVNDFKKAKESYKSFVFEVFKEYFEKKIASIYHRNTERKWFKSKNSITSSGTCQELRDVDKSIDFVKKVLENCPYQKKLLTELEAKKGELTKQANFQDDITDFIKVNNLESSLKSSTFVKTGNKNNIRWESLNLFFSSVFQFLDKTFTL